MYKRSKMKAITVSNFRSNLRAHLDEVIKDSEIIIIPRNNNEDDAIVVMSISEFNSMKETEYLLNSKKNRERLQKSLKEMKSGKTRELKLDQLEL